MGGRFSDEATRWPDRQTRRSFFSLHRIRDRGARALGREHVESPELVTAIAKAKNIDVVLRVVDESLTRAAEARKQREKDDAERRVQEERQRRAEEYDRQEQQGAEALAQREERLAEGIARREAEAEARQRASEQRAGLGGPLDVMY